MNSLADAGVSEIGDDPTNEISIALLSPEKDRRKIIHLLGVANPVRKGRIRPVYDLLGFLMLASFDLN